MSNRKLLELWFSELWAKKNPAIIDEMIDPDCKTHGLPEAMHGPAGFKPFYEVFGAAFANVDIRVEDTIELGDKIAFRCAVTLTGHDRKVHELTGGGICRFKNGRFIEAWNQWDFLSLLTALGHVGQASFADAMKQQARLRTS